VVARSEATAKAVAKAPGVQFDEATALGEVLTMLLAVVTVADNDTRGDTPADLRLVHNASITHAVYVHGVIT
jgi:hypothetical protein